MGKSDKPPLQESASAAEDEMFAWDSSLNCSDKCTRGLCGDASARNARFRPRSETRPSSAMVAAPDPELESCEPLGDHRGLEYAILTPSAFGYHPVTLFNLAGIDVVDFFTAVLLADPFRRAVELHGPLLGRILVTNGQRRFILTDRDYNALPTRRLRCLRLLGSLLREHRR